MFSNRYVKAIIDLASYTNTQLRSLVYQERPSIDEAIVQQSMPPEGKYMHAIHKSIFGTKGIKLLGLEKIKDGSAIGWTLKILMQLNFDKKSLTLSTVSLIAVDINNQLEQLIIDSIIALPVLNKFIMKAKYVLNGHHTDGFLLFSYPDHQYRIKLLNVCTINTQQITFISDVFEDSRILVGTVEGMVYFMSIHDNQIEINHQHQSHKSAIDSIKYLPVDYNKFEYMVTSTHQDKTIKKWCLTNDNIEGNVRSVADLLWETQINPLHNFRYNNMICILKDFVIVVVANQKPRQGLAEPKNVILLLDRQSGLEIRSIEYDFKISYIASHRKKDNVAIVYGNHSLLLVDFTEAKMQSLKSFSSEEVLRSLNYPDAVINIHEINENNFCLSAELGVVKFDLSKPYINNYTNFSLNPEHYGVSAWTFLDANVMLCAGHAAPYTLALKIYKPAGPFCPMEKFRSGARKSPHAIITQCFFNSPIYDEKLLSLIDSYLKPNTNSPIPTAGGRSYQN